MTQDNDTIYLDDEEAARQQYEQWEAALTDKAEKCLRQHPDNVRRAGKLMAAEVRADPRLQQAALGMLLEQACQEWVRRQVQARNQRIWHADRDITQRSSRLRAAGLARMTLRMMDYALMNGQPLGDATKADLMRNATFQDRQARRMAQTALWLGMIAENLPDDTVKVRDVLTEQQLRNLQQQVLGYSSRDEPESVRPSRRSRKEKESL